MADEITNSLQRTTATTAYTQQKSDPSDISMDDFLKILAASMSNPNVMGGDSGGSGNAGTDYIGQFVQFTTLQQIKELGDSMEANIQMTQQQQAFSMIGQEVKLQNVTLNAQGKEELEIITGKVEKVVFENGFGKLFVNGKAYYMSALAEVGQTGTIVKPEVEAPSETPETPAEKPEEQG